MASPRGILICRKYHIAVYFHMVKFHENFDGMQYVASAIIGA